MTSNQIKLKHVLMVLAILLGVVGAVGLASAQTGDSTTYNVTATLNGSGDAQSIDVAVDGQDQGHDLVANGSFSTTLTNDTVVTFTASYADDTTASADYTVGSGLQTLDIGNARIDIEETEEAAGGGGGASDSGDLPIPDWMWQAVAGAVIAGFFFKFSPFTRDGDIAP